MKESESRFAIDFMGDEIYSRRIFIASLPETLSMSFFNVSTTAGDQDCLVLDVHNVLASNSLHFLIRMLATPGYVQLKFC